MINLKMNHYIFVRVVSRELVTVWGTVIVERNYFNDGDIITSSKSKCKSVPFLVLLVEFVNEVHGIDVEEITNNLGILVPI